MPGGAALTGPVKWDALSPPTRRPGKAKPLPGNQGNVG